MYVNVCDLRTQGPLISHSNWTFYVDHPSFQSARPSDALDAAPPSILYASICKLVHRFRLRLCDQLETLAYKHGARSGFDPR